MKNSILFFLLLITISFNISSQELLSGSIETLDDIDSLFEENENISDETEKTVDAESENAAEEKADKKEENLLKRYNKKRGNYFRREF